MGDLTFVVPVLNGSRYLEEFRDSFRNLNIDYNLIFIDGGSLDDTIERINVLFDGLNCKVVIQAGGGGIYGAMNEALNFVTTQYVAFYGVDDRILSPFERMYISLVEHQGDMIYGGYYNLAERKKRIKRFNKIDLLFTNICHQAAIYRSSLVIELKFDLAYRAQADHLVNIQIFGGSQKILYFPEVVCNYDGGGYSFTNPDKLFRLNFPKIIADNFGFMYGLLALLKFKLVNLVNLFR